MKASKEFFGKFNNPSQTPSQATCKTSPCLLCERSTPTCLLTTPSWRVIGQVVLYCLHQANTSGEYIDLKTDIVSFVNDHFDLLHCAKNASKWKKLLVDSFIQNKEVFACRNNDRGFWKLVKQADPWTDGFIDAMPIGDSARTYEPNSPNSPNSPNKSSTSNSGDDMVSKDRRKRSLPYPKRPKMDERNGTSMEDEFRELQKEIAGKMDKMKKDVQYFRSEVQERHTQNMLRIQQMDELLGTFCPGLISTLQKYIYVSSRQLQTEGADEDVAKTVLAIEGLEEIHHQWRENKDNRPSSPCHMHHRISFITS